MVGLLYFLDHADQRLVDHGRGAAGLADHGVAFKLGRHCQITALVAYPVGVFARAPARADSKGIIIDRRDRSSYTPSSPATRLAPASGPNDLIPTRDLSSRSIVAKNGSTP